MTYQQAKQALSMVNVARSIYDISVHATMYIPLRVPSFQLPPYVHLERSSQWHLSALLSMAVETMTLPTRGRLDGERHGLDVLESSLNVTGNQRIARLQCNISHRSIMEPRDELPESSVNDSRRPASSIDDWRFREDLSTSSDTSQDMDFSGAGGKGSRNRIFGRVESLRGYSRSEEIVNGDDLFVGMRERRRLESRRIEKSVPRIPFSVPASLMNWLAISICFLASLAVISF